ncbi:hypothetical protein BU23DRAFT_553670 [Bimuria novae-zelandiae CBS 107.79]|uniref:Uncharacterized protein n=1 Tax=Bimuria novae-zelandiae CBS 107.79 TaxID=1447943 RepID=A0A6A5VA21_9PLEO|nr:hypothetical protein BU23DRAFT_553670 [Bimuria novae-zelandiae CBS 107.79]
MHCALRSGRLLLRMRARPLPPRRPFVASTVRFRHRDQLRMNKKGELQIGENGPVARLPTEEDFRPMTEAEINDPNQIPVYIYEEDPTSPTGERLVKKITTPEERRDFNEMHKMLIAADEDPNYDEDNPELNRRLINELMQDPAFADLTEELKDIKEEMLLTKAQREHKLADTEAAEAAELEPMQKELEDMMQTIGFEMLHDLMTDPAFEYAKDELAALQDALPEAGEDSAEYQAAAEKAIAKLQEDPNFEQKMADWEAANSRTLDSDDPGEMDAETLQQTKEMEELTQLLGQMMELTDALGNSSALEKLNAEMKKALDEELEDDDAIDEEEHMAREMSFAELGKEIMQLAQSNPEGGVKEFRTNDKDEDEDEDSDPVDLALEAKVDEIMKDPNLMEKLMFIQKVMQEEQQKQAILEQLAPDPTTLEPHRLTSIQQRMQMAKQDPEHRAALQALRVELPSPFNIAPALRIFNEAIVYAYVGANDDIRRILWRAYIKARALPTFLQNLSNDAWDILYYSQAVTWRGNQNREAHLKLLMQDLESVGMDGPPTHPTEIVMMQQRP